MNTAYQPSNSLGAKISRKLLPFRARRDLHFKLDHPVVSFTFDDFPKSAVENGAKILEAEGWKATFYIACGLMGIDNHHGQNFTQSDIAYIMKQGHEIAGHTYSHIDCTNMSTDAVLGEIERNQKALTALGVTSAIDHFAYPFGAASAELKQVLAERFKTMRGIAPDTHIGKADLNGLKSAPIFSGEKLGHTLSLIEGLKANPSWLTLFAHDIRDEPSEWGCTPTEFLQIVNAVKESGALVLSIGAAHNLLEAKYG